MSLENIGKLINNILGGVGDKSSKSTIEFMGHFYHISDFLPYKYFDNEEKIFISEDGIGFILETTPLVGNTEKTQTELSNIFTQILPVESSIQVMLYADKNIDHLMDAYVKVRENSSHTLQQLAIRRSEHLKQLALQSHLSPYVLRDYRCFLSVSMHLSAGTSSIEGSIKKTVDIRKQIISTMGVAGIHSYSVCATSLLRFLDSIFNSNFDNTENSQKSWNRFDFINKQVIAADSTISVEEDVVKLRNGEVEVKTFSISKYPEEWSLGMMTALIGDVFKDNKQFPYPFLLHYGVHIPKQSAPLSKISTKATLVEKQFYSPIGRFLPDIERELNELRFTQKQIIKGDKLVSTQFNIILFAPKDEMAVSEQILHTMFSSLLFKIEANSYTHLHQLLTSLPLAWDRNGVAALKQFNKFRTTLSLESANLLPQQAEWKGTGTPAMILGGRRGQLMNFCPFDNKGGNYNVTVVGRSGSGKSVFMQELMASTMGLGGRVFVLDVGRSFEKTCYTLEGQFIEFSHHQRDAVCLNPFSTLDLSSNEAVEDALAMLKSVLQLMAAPINGVDDKGAALLEQAMNESFKKYKTETTVTRIANYLKNLDDIQAKDLGQMLYPYTEFGAYGKYFNGKANIDLNNNLVVIELEELKERKDLQSVVVQMMVINITNKMFLGDRKTPFNIVFDEAWDMLRGKQGGVFIETLARRLRKYRGSLVVGTQSVNDFYTCAGAQAAWDNSDWSCFLSQKDESIEQLKQSKRITVDDYKERLLKSVTTVHGKFAEIMIDGSEGYAVGRLLLDPFSQLLFSTKA